MTAREQRSPDRSSPSPAEEHLEYTPFVACVGGPTVLDRLIIGGLDVELARQFRAVRGRREHRCSACEVAA